MLNRIHPYKGIRIHLFTYAFFLLCLSIFCAPELQRPSPHFPPQPSPAMSGAGGKWMVSSKVPLLNYTDDICGDLIFDGFEPQPSAPHCLDGHDLAIPPNSALEPARA